MAKDESPTAAPSVSAPAPRQCLLNRLNHPVTLSYGDDVLIVPPRGQVTNVNKAKLGALPQGVSLVPVAPRSE